MTATQGGVSVFSGTVDANGQFTFTVQSTTLVTITINHPSGRFASKTVVIAPTCNQTKTTNQQLSPATGYVCIPATGVPISGHILTCNWPLSTTLHLTSPSGNTVALTYNASGINGAGWYNGQDTVNNTTVCIPQSTATETGTVTVTWECMTGAGLFGQYFLCAGCGSLGNCYPAPDGTAVSDLCTSFTNQFGCVAESDQFTSLTCPEAGAFLLSATVDLPELISGNVTITE